MQSGLKLLEILFSKRRFSLVFHFHSDYMFKTTPLLLPLFIIVALLLREKQNASIGWKRGGAWAGGF